MTLTVVKTTALTGTITNAQLAGGIDLTAKVTGTLPIANGGTNSTATTFVNATTNVTGALPIVNGGTGATTFSPGKIGQVVSLASSPNSVSISSGSYTALTDGSTPVSLSITPSAASSKIFCQVSIQARTVGSRGYGINITRSGTQFFATPEQDFYNGLGATDTVDARSNWLAIDSPNSTSALTYAVGVKTNGGNAVGFQQNSAPSSFVLMEILA
jgi:hypothetical protein